METVHPEVVIFVEDPGAANYVIPLMESFKKFSISAQIFSEGSTVDYLRSRGLACVNTEAINRLEDFSNNLKCFLFGTSDLPHSRALTLMQKAKKLSIPALAILDGPANIAHRFSGGGDQPFLYEPDYLLLADFQTKRAAEDLGYPAEKIIVVGNPYYDWILEKRAELNIAPAKPPKTIGFFSEPRTGLNPKQLFKSQEYTLSGWGDSDGRNEVVLEEFIDAIGPWRSSVKLILRLHPKNSSNDFCAYRKYFDELSHAGDGLKVISECDLVVGQTSIVLLEAALLGIPTLSIVPRAIERDWLTSIGWGMTPCAFTRVDLKKQIETLMTSAAVARPLPKDVIGVDAAKNIVQVVQQVMKKSGN